jgi:hypothetical protein
MKDSVPGRLSNGKDVCAIAVTFHPDPEFPARLGRILGQVGALVIVDNGSGGAAVGMLRELAMNPLITLVLNLDNLSASSGPPRADLPGCCFWIKTAASTTTWCRS